MFQLRQDEKVFWKTMNPRRLHALFNAHFSPRKKAAEKQNEETTQSLSAYFMGGG